MEKNKKKNHSIDKRTMIMVVFIIIVLIVVGIFILKNNEKQKQNVNTPPDQNAPIEDPEFPREQPMNEEDSKPESVEPYLWEK